MYVALRTNGACQEMIQWEQGTTNGAKEEEGGSRSGGWGFEAAKKAADKAKKVHAKSEEKWLNLVNSNVLKKGAGAVE